MYFTNGSGHKVPVITYQHVPPSLPHYVQSTDVFPYRSSSDRGAILLRQYYDSTSGLILEDSKKHMVEGSACKNARRHSLKRQEMMIDNCVYASLISSTP